MPKRKQIANIVGTILIARSSKKLLKTKKEKMP